MKLEPRLIGVLPADLGEIIFHDPAAAGRTAITAIAEGLQVDPIGAVEVNIREMSFGIHTRQPDLLRPALPVREGKLRRCNAVPAETHVIQSRERNRPVF